ncbi:MAG TPA: DinB family protein [Abditibacteriaceae bacterium]|jgi:uncharacterized damage-inducible protein DinB|nr:DinB family protein [Abditibacteriaceae bacterium]
METTELLIGQMEWATRNVNNNLDFIPNDKLNWKPAPEANSVLEVVNHVAYVIHGFPQLLDGGEANAQWTPATNREEAKASLQKGTEAYVAKLRTLTPQDMARTVTLPFGEMPMPVAAMIPVIDLINHHGQITYIQTLLGDTESHITM